MSDPSPAQKSGLSAGVFHSVFHTIGEMGFEFIGPAGAPSRVAGARRPDTRKYHPACPNIKFYAIHVVGT